MTLAPYWASLEPHFRLLHVVRDGRDIALSANQGKSKSKSKSKSKKDLRLKGLFLLYR